MLRMKVAPGVMMGGTREGEEEERGEGGGGGTYQLARPMPCRLSRTGSVKYIRGHTSPLSSFSLPRRRESQLWAQHYSH
jgi:hypothetical protein